MFVPRIRAYVGPMAYSLVLALPVWALGQAQQTEPPPRSQTYEGTAPAQNANFYGGGGGWGGGYHSSTAVEGALQGMSSAISAQGQKNLNDSLALRNVAAAQDAEIDNYVKYTEAKRWRYDTQKQRREQETAERVAKYKDWHAKIAVQTLTPQQFNQASGTVRWPMVCTDKAYDDYRMKLDELFAKRAKYGAISMEEFTDVEKTVDDWRTAIRADQKKYPMSAVKQALSFLNSLTKTLNEQFG